ncbi:hypothetical protein BN1211_4642 [Cyberlindnera jadinii]|uniref:BZIP domain-containing protein n=1 Tax=Cyberlindnera jadinii (strain ATCC 18201 / CBS 1600 / BCRC 20928 / JCM 3617 / NBRC 0987 / NRRL Y-1542) TaxID=983966 RepID=A0A0H5C737_CYBJN|nr:hypothetical protein BN1211_4642 [Cyberlindnera jadinii]
MSQGPLSTAASSKTSFDLEPNPFEQSFASKDGQSSTAGGSGEKPPTIGGLGTSPQILTPGGRKLPPLVLSPNVPSSWGNTQYVRTGLTPNDSNIRTGLTPGGQSFPHSLQNMSLPGVATPGSLGFPGGLTPGLSSFLASSTKDFDQQLQADDRSVRTDTTDANASTNTNASANTNTTADIAASTSTMQAATADAVTKQNALRANGDDSVILNDAKPKGKRGRKRTGKAKQVEAEERKAKKPKSESEGENNGINNDNSNGNDEDATEEQKRKSFLERNRMAASKCRKRKKEQIIKMENDLNFYLNEYNNLTSALDQLRQQSLLLHQSIVEGKQASALSPIVDTILQTINGTNYIARLRGDNPSHIVPTVQPIKSEFATTTQQQQQQQQQQLAASVPIAPPVTTVTVPGGPIQTSPQVGAQVVQGPQLTVDGQLRQQITTNGVNIAPPEILPVQIQGQAVVPPQVVVVSGNGKVTQLENMNQWAPAQ